MNYFSILRRTAKVQRRALTVQSPVKNFHQMLRVRLEKQFNWNRTSRDILPISNAAQVVVRQRWRGMRMATATQLESRLERWTILSGWQIPPSVTHFIKQRSLDHPWRKNMSTITIIAFIFAIA